MSTNPAFKHWWFNEGSGMPPLKNEDAETHVRRIAEIAWSNGAYHATIESPPPLKADVVYEVRCGHSDPRWMTCETSGQVVAYHYIEEAAQQMADALNNRSRLRAFLVQIEGNDYCALHRSPPGQCPSCLAKEALKA